MSTRTAGGQVVAALAGHGVDRVFGVAGESYLPVLDALYDTPGVDVVTCRHEGSAGFAALADAKLTGRAGVCLVNRGPGAANAAIAVHAAAGDAAPLVLLVGQSKLAELDGPAFQEIDAGAVFGGLAKGVWMLRSPERAGELTARAIRVAEAGTPGPTVLAMPEDVLGRPVTGPAPTRFPVVGSAPTRLAGIGSAPARLAGAGSAPGLEAPGLEAPELGEVAALLAAARRPLLVAGSRVDTAAGRRLLPQVAARHALAVAGTAKRQDLYDNTDPHYAGHLHIATPAWQRSAFGEADLVIALGTRLDSVSTRGYTVFAAPVPAQPLVHVYPDPAALGRVYQPAVGIAADPVAFLAALSTLEPPPPEVVAQRRRWVHDLHEREAAEAVWGGQAAGDGVVFGAVVAALDRLTGGAAVVAVDAGNFTSFVHRYYRVRGGGRLLGIAPGSMGFGVPAGLAAALRRGSGSGDGSGGGSGDGSGGGVPDRPVVTVVGDGGALMTGAELATAVARRVRLCVVIADNGSYGTIRAHQERAYPGRVIATDLANPDFAAWATAHGALGLAVTSEAAVEPAIRRALDHDGPAVVAVRTSLTHISAYGRIE
ncbi:MAG TPA: thiamine pyrophosphate-dependent enzyme [Micromonosporaceae bacterium]|nr:thiamine pyrophosphate-dependent enzyme [Micromonosporaceae bacterium]